MGMMKIGVATFAVQDPTPYWSQIVRLTVAFTITESKWTAPPTIFSKLPRHNIPIVVYNWSMQPQPFCRYWVHYEK